MKPIHKAIAGVHAVTTQLNGGGIIAAQLLGGLLIAAAILVATYSVAAVLVNGAALHSRARTDSAMVLQQATANYRQARGQCQRLPANRISACIAEAHADEDRARTVASLAPQGRFVALRSKTDAAIDAGDRDSIIIEPACNVVARGQAGLCQIQVKANAVTTLAKADAYDSLLQARAFSNAGSPVDDGGNHNHARMFRNEDH